jgi:probable HAF family extracellular repeat protein
MRSICLRSGAAVVFAVVLTVAVKGHDRGPWYRSIDIPGATFTTAQGISGRGVIVGWYVDATGTHGYQLAHGRVTKIDYPGAAYTDARGINARGEIVGAYRMLGEPAVNFHGYVRDRFGEFTAIDFPGHTNLIPQRITWDGWVLGCRHDTDLMSTMRGIAINSHDTSETRETGLFASMNNGSTPDGSVVVGLYTDMDTGKGHAYLLYGDSTIPFDVPGSTLTSGWDVNAEGQVVGAYRDGNNKFHGFLWADLRFASIDYPEATATRAFGINGRGDVVGAYVDGASHTHGFVVMNRDRWDDDEHDDRH